MMLFINTRPTSRAKNLTTFLHSQGINVLNLPLLELVACDLSEPEKHYLHNINDYQAVMFVSETAVTYFFEFIKNHQILLNPNLTFIAVGQKTAQTFQRVWQNNYPTPPKLITPSEFNLPENNKGLLQLPYIQRLKTGDTVLLLKGKDGRDLLKNTLLEKGVTVDSVDFYQRIFPANSTQIFQAFCQSKRFLTQKIVLISSLTAWENWQMLIQPHFKPTDFNYLVLQQRIADSMLQAYQKRLVIQVIEDLQPATIVDAIQYFSIF